MFRRLLKLFVFGYIISHLLSFVMLAYIGIIAIKPALDQAGVSIGDVIFKRELEPEQVQLVNELAVRKGGELGKAMGDQVARFFESLSDL